MDDAKRIAAGLTKAQRWALLTAPSTPLGNHWLTCSGSTKSALVARRLATSHGDWCILTPLGLAVRAELERQSNGK